MRVNPPPMIKHILFFILWKNLFKTYFLCICFILEDTLYLEFNQNNKNLIPPPSLRDNL